MSDLISRQAAIDAVIAEGRNVDSRYLESERIIHESDAVEAISMLPSAQQWIPCSERLPVEGESVLLCDRNGNMTLGRLVRTDEGYKWDIYAWWNDIDDWNAWMELPEPYKGVTE